MQVEAQKGQMNFSGAKSVALNFGQTSSKKQIDHLPRLRSITTMPNMAPRMWNVIHSNQGNKVLGRLLCVQLVR